MYYLFSILTKREREYLVLAKNDLADKEIADRMHISVHTVSSFRNNIREKLGTKSKLGSVIKAIKQNIITL